MQPAPPAPAFLAPLPLSRPPRPRARVAPCRPFVCLGQTLSALDRDLHPVLALLRTRLHTASRPGARARDDTARIALCIEGGGMRGAVGAGMVAAIRYIGLHDAFDAVYGTSAGAVVGAYFVAGQVPLYGSRIYYDALCAPERRFIDLRRLRHHPYLQRRRRRRRRRGDNGTDLLIDTDTDTDSYSDTDSDGDDVYGHRLPVLHLDSLVDDVLATDCPLDWAAFDKRQSVQPLHAVATSLRRLQPVVLSGFESREVLSDALRASARVPGIAGPPVQYGGLGCEPLADGLLVEGIPFRSARAHGCTHALALCTRPRRAVPRQDAARVQPATRRAARAGLYELVIARPYLRGAAGLDETERAALWAHMSQGRHHAQYGHDVERLARGNGAAGVEAGFEVFGVAPDAGCKRVGQLETRPRRVFQGVRDGFATAYDALSPFAGGDAGRRVAELLFPEAEIAAVERRHDETRRLAHGGGDAGGSAGELDLSTMTERFLVG